MTCQVPGLPNRALPGRGVMYKVLRLVNHATQAITVEQMDLPVVLCVDQAHSATKVLLDAHRVQLANTVMHRGNSVSLVPWADTATKAKMPVPCVQLVSQAMAMPAVASSANLVTTVHRVPPVNQLRLAITHHQDRV